MFSLCCILNGLIFRNILSRTSCFFANDLFFLLEASRGILSIKNSARDTPNSCASRASNQSNMILSFPRLFVFLTGRFHAISFFFCYGTKLATHLYGMGNCAAVKSGARRFPSVRQTRLLENPCGAMPVGYCALLRCPIDVDDVGLPQGIPPHSVARRKAW